jgi:hypothetical protein
LTAKLARLYTGDPTALCPHDREPKALNGLDFDKMLSGRGMNRIRHERLGDGRSVCIYKPTSPCSMGDLGNAFNNDPESDRMIDEPVMKVAILFVPTQG